MFQMLTRVFGSRNERIMKTMHPIVDRINSFESDIQALTDAELTAKTDEFKSRLEAGESLDDILPEAFAVVREASQRTLGMRHFDMQLIGGMILHQGNIAEMKTGEGKTLVATLPVYLNALTGKGVHVITVNDYLARRDAEWMGQIYRFLGMDVGIIVHGLENDERRAAYDADITYGTNNEFGFDYLRDNMAFAREELVRARPLYFAIVDEVDSILIDESRTPLIISGPAEKSSELYAASDKLIRMLDESDYEKDEKQRAVSFTEEGLENVERLFQEAGLLKNGGFYDPENVNLVHASTQSLRANTLFTREVDYIVNNGEVVIIDEFTGRMMPGRRYSDGLHQALEAKEGVEVKPENQTLASITFQNFFRMYDKLSGMTGTAQTEAEEFQNIYKLEVVEVPTNQDMIRDDLPDLVYRGEGDKYQAIIRDIVACHDKGQPVLVGTISIEKSEELSEVMKKKKISHEVLNAKNHEREAAIVGQAGRKSAVTIATNMAGRGTDIVLGGNPDMMINQLPANEREKQAEAIRQQCASEHEEVLAAGGLHIIGTERHESRRIDNQLRGRSGRQGDPGSSQFFLSLEDDLMRIFGGEKMQAMLQKIGFDEGEVIEHPWVTKAIENAQKKVEGRNFDIRKHLLEFDDVMNQQREVIYSQRLELLHADDVADVIDSMRHDFAEDLSAQFIDEHGDGWDAEGLEKALHDTIDLSVEVQPWIDAIEVRDVSHMADKIVEAMRALMLEKEQAVGAENLRRFEKFLLLQVLDNHWKDHLLAMDHLKQGIGLRGYAQKQPLQEYKHESFELFASLMQRVRLETITMLQRVQVEATNPAEAAPPKPKPQDQTVQYSHGEPQAKDQVKTVKRKQPKVGRNAPCPCGSGKKYKNCHGKTQAAA
ncbi:MAG: preprotein translocase subunit SecA [Mariprofundaceae bacterium]